MARPKADRDAILVALLDAVGGLPPHFDLERFSDEVERWTSEGKTAQQIARLIVEQCRACVSKPRENHTASYFTVEAFYKSGGLFRSVEHVIDRQLAATKQRLQREAKEPLAYALLSEGSTPRTVQGRLNFTNDPDGKDRTAAGGRFLR